jgi:coenzyme PQQ precursor peptide PqqA
VIDAKDAGIEGLPAARAKRPAPSARSWIIMSWKAPKVVEIALGAEINSYACAEARK